MNVSAEYEPFSSRSAVDRFRIAVDAPEGGGCVYELGFEALDGRGLRDGGETLEYLLQDAGGRRLRLDGRATLRLRAGRGGTDEGDVFVVIPGGQSVPAGRYEDRGTVFLFHEDRLIDRADWQVTARAVAQATIVAGRSRVGGQSVTGGAGMDFGILEEGEEQAVFLHPRSNARYELTISSQNGSVLRRDGGGVDSVVPYSAFLDGRRLDLARRERVTGDPALPRSGSRFLEFRVRIGPTAEAVAGRYSDVVTVEIRVLE